MSNAFRYLRQFAFIIFCIQCSMSAKAQQQWFLYIQSESNQPFYVRIGENIYNSSKVGHLVINGLRDSTYRLAIGFPQTQYREHQFSIPIRKKDHGFELKKGDSRSWVLYDWQAQETIRAPRTDSLLYGERKKDDGFASLMASVVNDSAVLYTSVVKTDPPQKTEVRTITPDTNAVVKAAEEEAPVTPRPDTLTAVAVSDTEKKIEDTLKTEPVLVKTETPKMDPEKDTATHIRFLNDTNAVAISKPVQEEKTPPISKLQEETDEEEKKLVFLDNTIGIKKDTITVVIPLDKDSAVQEKSLVKEEVVKETPRQETIQPVFDSVSTIKKGDTIVIAKAETEKTDTLLVAKATMKKTETPVETIKEEIKDTTTEAVNKAEPGKPDTAAVTVKEPEPEKSSNLVMINSDCVKFATDSDLDKLRIRMMKENDAGNRIFVAHKAFKNMCFATRQIKALSELFPNDELRFRFFETAWPFVSDTSQFKTLEETLSEEFFITRFRTLLRRQ